MGSFNKTCAVSGLPIEAGTPVRALLLVKDPYEKGWLLRTPPIRGECDDYGGIESIHPDDEQIVQLWSKALERDLVEKEVGDNTCHDVAIRKNSIFEELCQALYEDRVEVYKDWDREYDELIKSKVSFPTVAEPACIPRLEKIKKILSEQKNAKKLLVDEPVTNLFRVRITDNYGKAWGKDEAILKKILPVFQKEGYSCMICAGTGSYAGAADILISPAPVKPGSQDHVHGVQWEWKERPKTLPLTIVQVREDVWQVIQGMKLKRYCYSKKGKSGYKTCVVGDYIAAYKEVFDKLILSKHKEENSLHLDLFSIAQEIEREDLINFVITSASAFSIKEHISVASQEGLTGNRVVESIAETQMVTDSLSFLRHDWHPTGFEGSQLAEWKNHKAFSTGIQKIIKDELSEQIKRQKEYDEYEEE